MKKIKLYNLLQKLMNSIDVIKMEEQNQRDDSDIGNQLQGPFFIQNVSVQPPKPISKISEWTLQENSKYVAFIEKNSERMEGKPHGRLWGLYQEMAKHVETRNFRQCKLHHQKLTNDIGKISDISFYFMRKFPEFEEVLLEERQKLKIGGNESANIAATLNGQGQKNDKQDERPTDVTYKNDIDSENAITRKYTFPIVPKMVKIKEKEEKWEQCHQYFMEWTNRLNDLMRPQIYY